MVRATRFESLRPMPRILHHSPAGPGSARRAAPSRRALLAMLGTVPLAGCLGPSRGFNAHAGSELLAADPILHIITTRRLAGNGERAPFLEATRARDPSYLRARLEAPDGSVFGQLNPLSSDFSVKRVEPVAGPAAGTFAEALRGRDTLMFVHGYNQTFEAASRDAALLSDGIRFRGNTALFAWPSKGGLLDYGYDRESALLARDPFVSVLAALVQDPFGGRLHIVAHSMGTHLALEALRAFRDRHGETGLDRIGALVFASPDIDADVFRAGLDQIGRFREKLTVITATNDRALDISRRIAGGNRVGALPREELEGLGIRVIDATAFASGLIRHDAFVANADVRAVIRRAVDRA